MLCTKSEEFGSENGSGKEPKEEVARDASVTEAFVVWILLHHLLLKVAEDLAKGGGTLCNGIYHMNTHCLEKNTDACCSPALNSTDIPKILVIVHSMYARRTTLFASRSSLFVRSESGLLDSLESANQNSIII